MDEKDIAAFNAARETYRLPESVDITIHHERLADLDPELQFDCIVSPANSYARMDGGFDDALSRKFSPKDKYLALTRVAQRAVYNYYRGIAPPGSCLLIDLEKEDTLNKDVWGCKYMALCPTMKTPTDVRWDREIVHECIWTLLAAIDRHNRGLGENTTLADAEGSKRPIRSVLMTPFATGCGGWSAEKWAAQTVIAIRQFVDAVEDESKWLNMGALHMIQHTMEVERTFEPEVQKSFLGNLLSWII